MSESDDTDILLLIPPDLFTVASSGSEENLPKISGLLDQVELLDNQFKGLTVKSSLSKAASMPHKLDLLTPETFDSSRHSRSPFTTSKKCPSKAQNYSSPLRYVSSTTSTNDSSDKRQSDMYSRYVRSSTISDNINAGTENLCTNRSNLMDPFSPIHFKPNNSYDANYMPPLDLNRELKDSNSMKQNTERLDFLGTGDFAQYLNNSSSGTSLFDRTSSQKSPKRDQFSKTIRDISKIHENYSKLSTSSEVNTANSRNYNLQLNSDYRSLSTEKQQKDGSGNMDSSDIKSQRLLSLTDFWEPDSSKTEVEKLRIKLEEEKFRREHCERTIQELQKRLLEQQEKVAVAIGVDKEKNTIIHQYQSISQKLKIQFQALQSSHRKLEETSAGSAAKHQVETDELKGTMRQLEEQLAASRALAQEYKEKADVDIEEKLQLLASHASELENCKSFVRKAEEKYEMLKGDYDKLMDKLKMAEESSSVAQQDLYRERLKAGEIRSEMAVIHKALDTCEAELTVLRQEKENLQLKLKEEEKRCAILESKKSNLLEELNTAKKSEEQKIEEMKKLVDQQDQIRAELRDIYQNQVDDVVKVKLKEFQAHLDTAESSYKTDLEVKQRAIAECAAGKIKNLIDKHQLEVNLLEEKHREEKRLCELRLSQTLKKTNFLEAKINAQQEAKSKIAEQLHSLMEKQWKQAVQIISSGNPQDSIIAGNDFSFGNSDRRELQSFLRNRDIERLEPVKLELPNRKILYSHQEHDESLIAFSNNEESQERIAESKEDLRKYVKMILQMQEAKSFPGANGGNESPVSSSECRQVPRKYYTKADAASTSEKTVTWQQTEPSTVYNAVSMTQVDNKPSKPPWK